ISPPPGAPRGPGDGAEASLPTAPPCCSDGGQDMRSAFDFGNVRRSSVGFDRLFDMLENSSFSGENYPPFDLIKLDDNRFRIEVAVAGFGRDDIEITKQQQQ